MPRLAVDETDQDVVVLHSTRRMPPRDVYVARRTGVSTTAAADRFDGGRGGAGRLLRLEPEA